MARIGFGIFDLVLLGGMIWTGVGTLPGIGLIAIGLDQIATGSINIRYGRVAQGFSILEFGVYRATGSETAAILAPGVFSLGFGSVGSLGRLGARAGIKIADASIEIQPTSVRLAGIGGQLYGVERLQTLSRYLARRNVKLEVGNSRMPPGYDGLLRTHLDGTATLFLKADPTKGLVWHELGHFIHWRRLGNDTYRGLLRKVGNNVPEQFVYDLLRQTGRWERLSIEYQQHMDWLINIRWKGVGR